MSLAWETTPEDIRNVMAKHGKGTLTDKRSEDIRFNLNEDLIEKAALYGNDISEQTDYAYQEIERQLKEKNLL